MTGFYMIEISVIEELRTSCINNNGLINGYLKIAIWECLNLNILKNSLKKYFQYFTYPYICISFTRIPVGQILDGCTEFV